MPGTDAEAAYPLTAFGEVEAKAAGVALRKLGIQIDACICSPKLRALRTAELACSSLGVGRSVTRELSGEDFDAEALADREGTTNLLIVGHSPALEHSIRDITGGLVRVRKAGICSVFASENTLNLPPLAVAQIAGLDLNSGPQELKSKSLGPGQLPSRMNLRQQYEADARAEDDEIIALAAAAGLI
jgi:phosphohistidine phosphatase